MTRAAQPRWEVAPAPVDYPDAIARMDRLAAAIRAGSGPEHVWLLEHPPVYTAGTSADSAELVDPQRLPVHVSGRGGRYTYHGPGQRVAYVMLDLGTRGRDVRRFVASLEQWLIEALSVLGVAGQVRPGKVGVWVDTSAGPAKIAAIGVRVRRWVTLHGISINVHPELDDFAGIVPCGLSEPVTSLAALGRPADMAALDRALHDRLPAMLARLAA